MRRHDEAANVQFWSYGDAERRIARPDAVAIARFELIARSRVASGWLDLVLQAPDCTTVVCGIFIDLMALSRNDFGAITYPSTVDALFDEDGAAAMTAFLMPHLRMLTRGRVVPLEEVLRFAPSEPFDRARANGDLGAATLRTALPRVTRWLAAFGLAHGGTVAIDSLDAGLGWAAAARSGCTVTPGSTAPERGWFTLAAATGNGRVTVAVADTLARAQTAPLQVVFSTPDVPGDRARRVAVNEALPMDRMFELDQPDAPVAGEFWIVTPE
jgi:hypothetical protein